MGGSAVGGARCQVMWLAACLLFSFFRSIFLLLVVAKKTVSEEFVSIYGHPKFCSPL